MIIPGGAGDILSTPLSFRMSRIDANTTTDDGSPSDEVYVIATAIVLNWEKLWESKVFTNATRVYENMDDGDFRSIDVPVWGDDGAPIAVRAPKDVILLFEMLEHDNGAVSLATPLVMASVTNTVKHFNAGMSYTQMKYEAANAMIGKVSEILENQGGDDLIGHHTSEYPFSISSDQLTAARAGSVVKIPLVFMDNTGRGIVGKYTLTLELRK